MGWRGGMVTWMNGGRGDDGDDDDNDGEQEVK